MKKLFFVLIFAALYITTAELSAKKKAESLCNAVSIGDAASNLLEKAIEAGARKNGTYWDAEGSSKSLYAAFTGYYAGSDFICKIDTENGRVTAKNPNLITSLHLITSLLNKSN